MDYFERKLDDKNRLTIPSQLQEEFGQNVVITPGFKNYLHIYPESVWNKDMEQALQGDILDEATADLNVRFRAGKTVARLDGKQGRITLEAHHMALLGSTKEVVAVRAGKYFRISAK
jgi:MraZ protein